MLAYRYKVWSWGSQRTDGQEDCIKYDLGVTVVAKRHSEVNYEVFNELVCMNLGRAMGLPIPVGMIVEKDGDAYYCSGNISSPGNDFPPADLEHLAKNQSEMACGTALFDGWVCNDDRHVENIFYDTENGDVFLIDHGQALLNIHGTQHLRQNADSLLLRKEYADELMHFSSFSDWYKKLVTIPEHMITDACREASGVGIPMNEALEVASLLISRRSKMSQLFTENKSLFPKRAKGLFTPFECDDDPIDYSI